MLHPRRMDDLLSLLVIGMILSSDDRLLQDKLAEFRQRSTSPVRAGITNKIRQLVACRSFVPCPERIFKQASVLLRT